jgi:4-amino-4-deoxy-L-arabinose transferase-like glycosyltransferase
MLRLLVTIAIASSVFALLGILRGKTSSFVDGWTRPLRPDGGGHGVRWVDQAIGVALCATYVAVVLRTASTLGFTRDEGFYFDASRSYAGWFERALSLDPTVVANAHTQSGVDGAWAANAEHPSLMKSSFALSWLYLWRSWPAGLSELFGRHWWTLPLKGLVMTLGTRMPQLFIEESDAFRFPGMVTGGLTLWLTYLFGSEARGRLTGLLAALFFAGLPRCFFDSHLACFDAAATLMWLAVAYAWWKGLASAWWALSSGVVWGLALLTKHNSWFLPLVFCVHFAWLAIDVARSRPGAHPMLSRRLRSIPIPWPLLFMGMIGPAMFIAGWPRLWFDTWARIRWYFEFHAHHDYYNVEYLHKTYFQPPLPVSMPYVLVLATVPTTILIACLVGIARSWRSIFAVFLTTEHAEVDDARRTAFFWFLNLNLPIALIAHPKVPHFGGTKHWHPAYPFLCLFAGSAAAWAIAFLAERWKRRPVVQGALSLAFASWMIAPGWIETAKSHPHQLSDYMPIVGGSAGGATLGLNRGFWGYETGAIVDWLKVHFPKGARVYPNDTLPTSFEQLHADGRLPRAIEQDFWNATGTDVAVVEHEQHMDEVEAQIWIAWGNVSPAYVVTLQGVPTLSVYVNPKSSRYVP